MSWNDVTALLHKRGVVKAELIDKNLLIIARVGVVPLIRAEPGQDEEQDGDDEVGKDHVSCHEWVGEVNSLLSFISDG